jgi:hypothetical protein
VQIKKKICGDTWVVAYPTVAEETAIMASFARFCGAFNHLFYVPGKRHTVEDHLCGRKQGALTRHNLPHYSWIIQNICNTLDDTMQLRYELNTFFPLQKTHNVKKKLNFVWVLTCKHLGWELTLL